MSGAPRTDRAVRPDEREARLPKWAREEMEALRRDAVMARREAATARAENPAHEKQWAWLTPYRQEPIPLPVAPFERIVCTFPGGNPEGRMDERVSVVMREDGLEIMAHLGTLAVVPSASNVVRVTVIGR